MSFRIGDKVVHPRHGLGRITHLSIKQMDQGSKRAFYEISFPASTLWVPLALTTSGLRKLTVKAEINNCRRVLSAAPMPLNHDPRYRQSDLVAHLKQGTLRAHCEVVRDLTAYGWQNTLGEALSSFLGATQGVLCQEWAAVEGVTITDAADEIEALIEKGKPVVHYE